MKGIVRILNMQALKSVLCALVFASLLASPVFTQELPPMEMLEMAEELSFKASEMAIEAKATSDYYMAQHAFALAVEAAGWVGEVSETARQIPDLDLAHAAKNVANKIREVILRAQIAARNIAESNPDPDVVHAANFLFNSCNLALSQFGGPPQK
jgi:hypothetical protein